MQAVWVALIVATGAAASTLLTTWLNARQIRAGKAQDYERQDAVAAQAAEAARLLAERQDAIQKKAEEAARLLLAANERVARQTAAFSATTEGKLNQIHELVNSNLTSQMDESLTALAQQLVLMREVVTLNMAAGRKPSVHALEAITVIEHRVAELSARLAARNTATEIADAKVQQ